MRSLIPGNSHRPVRVKRNYLEGHTDNQLLLVLSNSWNFGFRLSSIAICDSDGFTNFLPAISHLTLISAQSALTAINSSTLWVNRAHLDFHSCHSINFQTIELSCSTMPSARSLSARLLKRSLDSHSLDGFR